MCLLRSAEEFLKRQSPVSYGQRVVKICSIINELYQIKHKKGKMNIVQLK